MVILIYTDKNKHLRLYFEKLLGSVPSKNKGRIFETDLFKQKFDICSIQFAVHSRLKVKRNFIISQRMYLI